MTRFFSCISYLLVMAVSICAQTTGPARSTVLRAERKLDVRQATIGRSPIIAIQAGKIVSVNEPPPAFFSTNIPLETNNVTLDPELKDAWGLTAIRVIFKEHPDDMKTKALLRGRCLEIPGATGAKTKSAPPPAETRSGHSIGTCCIGNDPKTSLVDRYHRAHDVPNRFVVDGSNFVTSASSG